MKIRENKKDYVDSTVIVLLGATASGKTKLAIELAETLDLNIINVDSRQLYEGMNIGTAKPTKEQQKRVLHYLLDLRKPNEPITVQEFQREAKIQINSSLASKKMAFLVGGSGLYLKAITGGLNPPKVGPQKIIREQLKNLGQNDCYQILIGCDPQAAKRISPQDSVRTQRALEVFYATGKTMSSQQYICPPPWKIIELGLDPEDLRSRIEKRTLFMYANGLIEETEALMKVYGANLPMLQTIGYAEAIQVIHNELTTSEAIAITTKRTQQFAKRQRTWFRKQHAPYWLNHENALSKALTLINGV